MASLKLVALCLFGAIALASARPRFVAIPIEDVQFLNNYAYPEGAFQVPYAAQGHRVRRAAQSDNASPPRDSAYAASNAYTGNDYVDYGAYTGGNGAFGWYSDHPVGAARY